jgi:hypothetical protein
VALEVAAAEVAFLLHVVNERPDGGASPQLAFDAEDAALLAGDEDPSRRRRIMTAISLVDVGALDLSSNEALGILDDGAQGVPVIGIAGQRLGMQHELATRGTGLGGDDRDLDAELVGRTGLAFANAFDLRGVEGIELPAALARRCERIWEALESGLSKAASIGSWPAILRRISRISRPSRVRRKRTS